MTPARVLAEFQSLQVHNDPVTAIAGFLDWCVDESIEVPFLKVLPEDLRYEPGWVELFVAMWGLAPSYMRYEIEFDIINIKACVVLQSYSNVVINNVSFKYNPNDVMQRSAAKKSGYNYAYTAIDMWKQRNPHARMVSVTRDDIATDGTSLDRINAALERIRNTASQKAMEKVIEEIERFTNAARNARSDPKANATLRTTFR